MPRTQRASSKRASGYRRRKFVNKKFAKKRTWGAATQSMQVSVRTLNPMKMPPLKIQKTVNYNLTIGTTWTAGTSPATALIFDPSGTYGNYSSAGGAVAMPDWASLAALYDQYRVKRIGVTFHYLNGSAAAGAVLPLWVRHNYEPSVTTPTMAGVSQLDNVKTIHFNPTAPLYTYWFKPKCLVLVDNGAVLATESRQIKDHDWTDVNFPAELWGLQAITNFTILTGQNLFFEVTYEVEYKYNK